MSKFVTTIKTNYTNVPAVKEKKTFVSAYSSKNARTTISGDNRRPGTKYASQLVK